MRAPDLRAGAPRPNAFQRAAWVLIVSLASAALFVAVVAVMVIASTD